MNAPQSFPTEQEAILMDRVAAKDVTEVAECDAPAFKHSPSKFSWQVMLFGGICPRTERAQQPLEFHYPASRYDADSIRRTARSKAELQYRTHMAIRAPLAVGIKAGGVAA